MKCPPTRFATVIILAVLCLGTAFVWKALGPVESPKPAPVAVTQITTTPSTDSPQENSAFPAKRDAVAKAAGSAFSQLTPEEKVAVQRQIEAAKLETSRLKALNRHFLAPFIEDRGHTEFVNVESFTDQQIDAFYTFLSQQGRAFPPGSPAALAYRERADALVYDLRKYPRMSVKKNTSPTTRARPNIPFSIWRKTPPSPVLIPPLAPFRSGEKTGPEWVRRRATPSLMNSSPTPPLRSKNPATLPQTFHRACVFPNALKSLSPFSYA